MNNEIVQLEKAIVEAENLADIRWKESINTINKITKKKDENSFLRLIINARINYLKSTTSIYAIILSNDIILDKDKKLELIVEYFKRTSLYNLNREKSVEVFKNEVAEWKYCTALYNLVCSIIPAVNNDFSHTFKFPQIENFEVDCLNQLLSDNEKINAAYNDLEKIYKDKIDDHFNYEKKLSNDLSELKSKIFKLENENRDVKHENELPENKYNFINEHFLKNKEALYVYQFDNLIWGDNYPALKVLYTFFHLNKMIDFNWSTFCNYMQFENSHCFNINTRKPNYLRKDLGYLFYRLHQFFISTSITNKQDYKKWLSNKLYINDKFFSLKMADKYVRGYDSDPTELNQKKAIDSLILDIKKRYN